MYLLGRSWGLQPSEIWAMTVQEWFWEFEQHTRDPKAEMRKEWAKQADLSDDEWWDMHGRKPTIGAGNGATTN